MTRSTAQEITARIEAERAAEQARQLMQHAHDTDTLAARWAWAPQRDAEEMAKLDRFLPDPALIPPRWLIASWEAYSNDCMASFLIVTPLTVSDFFQWMLERHYALPPRSMPDTQPPRPRRERRPTREAR